MSTQKYVCMYCHSRGAEVRLDKKGRPYVGCSHCACCAFPRGPQSLACVLATMRLLDTDSQLRWARQESFALSERPLSELLYVAPPTTLGSSITEAHAAAPAAVGGSR